MNIFTLLFPLLFFPLVAHADKTLAQVAYGVHVEQAKDGSISIYAANTLWLDDGRELHREGEKWVIVPPTPDDKDAITVKAIDLAVYANRYVGKRIKIIGGRFLPPDINGAELSLPGTSIYVDFSHISRASLKSLLQNCSDFGSISPVCSSPLIATVTIGTDNKFALTDPVLQIVGSAAKPPSLGSP